MSLNTQTYMTREEAIELLDAYDAAPDAPESCDNLCTVADALPGQPDDRQYTSDDLREMVDSAWCPLCGMIHPKGDGPAGYSCEA
jgi:hypothetical protein